MTSERDRAAWAVITGTARGAAHELRHSPSQDSSQSRLLAGGAGVVAAVADGHGARRHFRSATGSLLAVRAACAVAAELTAGAPVPWDAERAGGLRAQLPGALVARWRELVARHLAAHPYTPQEQAGLDLAQDGPDVPYGSTLIVALIVGDWLVCAQIGDGDLVAVRPGGEAWAPVSGDARLDGYHTTSLCQAGAVASFRAAAHDLRTEPLLALLLSTDGYGNAQATDPWQPAFARDLAGLAARHGRRWFEHQVPQWAQRCASADGSGDDTTIALLLAPDSVQRAEAGLESPPGPHAIVIAGPPSAWAPQSPAARARAAEAAEAEAGPRSAGASPPQRRRPPPGPAATRRGRLAGRRAVLAAIVAVLAVAAVVTAALLAAGSPGSAPVPHPTAPSAPRASRPATLPATQSPGSRPPG